ncbi:MAG: BON domain-containing protein [Actinobacteria bacterium]|nr:BON domain-containing protein [Actinomycetota bacterium]
MQTTDRISEITDRIGETVHDLRESAASSLNEVASSRELNRMSRRLSGLDEHLTEALAVLGDRIAAFETDLDGLLDRLDRGKTTTWPRRIFWFAVGTAAGAAAAGLLDPQMGRTRRAKLADQARATAKDIADDVRAQADYTAGVAKGAAIETAKGAFDLETVPADIDTLRQKIKSEVLGQVEGAREVDLDVEPGGRVILRGRVSDRAIEKQLMAAISDVAGVNEITDELEVTR